MHTILFDIDGTLVDTNDLHTDAWLEAFARFGKQFDRETMRHQIGKGGDLLVPDLLNAREMRTFGDELREYRGKLFKEQYMPRARPFPGVPDLFAALDRRGIRMALASSSNPDEVEYYARLLDVEKYLKAATSKEDAEFSKPSPEIFRAAMERAGADPEFTLVVGDTPYDVLAAHRIALPVVAVLSGGFERDLLAKAEFIFERATEIEERIDEIDAWFDA
jgi:HAD superfamily hydrolase (TIGR01549 family)